MMTKSRLRYSIVLLIILVLCSITISADWIDDDGVIGTEYACLGVYGGDDDGTCADKDLAIINYVSGECMGYQCGSKTADGYSNDEQAATGQWIDISGTCKNRDWYDAYFTDYTSKYGWGSGSLWTGGHFYNSGKCKRGVNGCMFHAVEDDPSKDDCLSVLMVPGTTVGNEGSGYDDFGFNLDDSEVMHYGGFSDSWEGLARDVTCAVRDNFANHGWQYTAPGGNGLLCMVNRWIQCDSSSNGHYFLTEEITNTEGQSMKVRKCSSGKWIFDTQVNDEDGDGYFDAPSSGAYGVSSSSNHIKFREVDCEDDEETARPGNTWERDDSGTFNLEICNDGLDNDCDGKTDAEEDGCGDFVDDDGDGLSEDEGDCMDEVWSSNVGMDFATNYKRLHCIFLESVDDCTYATSFCGICIHPKLGSIREGFEYCDLIDNDCDGYIDNNCEGDLSKKQCEIVGTTGVKWLGDTDTSNNEGSCCGDDYFSAWPGPYVRRISPVADSQNEDITLRDTFIVVDQTTSGTVVEGCFDGLGFTTDPLFVGGVTAFHIGEIDYTGGNAEDDNQINDMGSIYRRNFFHRKMIFNLKVTSTVPSILYLEGKAVDHSHVTSTESNSNSANTDVIFSTYIPSTEGIETEFEFEFSIPGEDSERAVFDSLRPDQDYGIQIRLTKDTGSGYSYVFEDSIYLDASIAYVNNRKILFSAEDEAFYSCNGIIEGGDIGDNSELIVESQGISGSEDEQRGVQGVITSGIDNPRAKPGEGSLPYYYETFKSPLTISNDKIIPVLEDEGDTTCSDKEGHVCQVNGYWEKMIVKGSGTALKSLPDIFIDSPPDSMDLITGYASEGGSSSTPIQVDMGGIVVTGPDTSGYPAQIPLKVPTFYSKGCCGPQACWNGRSCTATMMEPFVASEIEPQLTYDFDGETAYFMCIDGEWQEMVTKKDQYYHLESLCPESMCFLNGGNPEFVQTPPAAYDPEPGYDPYNIFYPAGQSWYDYTCVEGGEWRTRTSLLATHLLAILPDNMDSDNYELKCGYFKGALNDYLYEAVVPPHYTPGQLGPEAGEAGAEIIAYEATNYVYPYIIGDNAASNGLMGWLNDSGLYDFIGFDEGGDILGTFFNVGSEFPMMNNFCVLTYDDGTEDKVIMGVSGNNPVWSVGVLGGSTEVAPGALYLINNTNTTDGILGHCKGAMDEYTASGEYYYGCAGDNTIMPDNSARVWYNYARDSIIYSPDNLTIPSGIEWNADATELREKMSSPTKIGLSKFDLGLTQEEEAELWSLIMNGSDANNIYLSRSGDKEVIATFEKIDPAMGGIFTVMYSGFDMSVETNLCNDGIWWDNFKKMVDENDDIGCGTCAISATCKYCVCEYDDGEDVLTVSTYGALAHGSFKLITDMTSKLRYESDEGEGGLWAWMGNVLDWIIDIINSILGFLLDVVQSLIGIFT